MTRVLESQQLAPRRLRIVTATLLVMCQSSQVLANAGIALFLPLIRGDLGLSFTESGLFAVVSTATYALMQIPAGYLADRFGAKRTFVIGCVAVNALVLAFAAGESLGLMLLIQGASGVFRALMFAPGMLIMNRQFRADRRATAMGLFVALGFSSNVFLNTLGPLFVDDLGWRGLFRVFAALGISLLLGFVLVPDRQGSRRPRDHHGTSVRALFGHAVVWYCGGIQFVRLALASATMAWFPTMLNSDKGLSLRMVGAVMAVGAVLAGPANLLGGYVSDRFNRPVWVVMSSLVVISGTLLLLPAARGVGWILTLVSVNQFFLQMYFGPLFEIPMRVLPPALAGRVAGFSNMFANIGGLLAILLLGRVKDLFGNFGAGLYALAALCLVALVLAWRVGKLLQRNAPVRS